ncbi:MAG: hypothetical protein J0L61_07975, partial [Planctomycetes bacterium]|nr:hypothetical protein [Planctomycetota bacterium]
AFHARTLLEKDELSQFGCLLDDAWRLKRSLTKTISNPDIDAMNDAAMRAGAWGGKLLGAGGGGFLLVAAPPEAHPLHAPGANAIGERGLPCPLRKMF